MTRPLRAVIPHSLGKDEARRRIHGGFEQLQAKAGGGMLSLVSLDRRWEGDRMHLEGNLLGQKVTGRLDVLPDAIAVEVDLPALLVGMADKIVGFFTTETRKLLEKK